MTNHIECTGCGGGREDAVVHDDGLCCIAQVECICGELVEGDGTPTCEVCEEPLCDECRDEDVNGCSVHEADCLDEYTAQVRRLDDDADRRLRLRKESRV